MILFVGTRSRPRTSSRLRDKCESAYVNQRWLGGLLTNFGVVRTSVDKLKELEEMKEDGRWDLLSKEGQSKQEKVYRKLQKNLGGLKTMAGLPGAIFIIDSSKETIAIAEATRCTSPSWPSSTPTATPKSSPIPSRQ